MMGKLGYRIYIFFIVFCDIVEKNQKIKVLNDELGNLKIQVVKCENEDFVVIIRSFLVKKRKMLVYQKIVVINFICENDCFVF